VDRQDRARTGVFTGKLHFIELRAFVWSMVRRAWNPEPRNDIFRL